MTRPVRLVAVKIAYWRNSSRPRCIPRIAAANGIWTR